jgi:hypothetical protein
MRRRFRSQRHEAHHREYQQRYLNLAWLTESLRGISSKDFKPALAELFGARRA